MFCLVCLLTASANSGIFVQEGLARGQRLPSQRETAVAFIGSAPRGPVGIPVFIRSLEEYLRRFGAAGHRGRTQDLLAQFFDNGGVSAIVVRACSSERRHRIALPAGDGLFVLNAVNPGSHECLRACVDYEGIPAGDEGRFNLVVHRLASRERPIVERQEIYRALSMDPSDPDFVTYALIDSELVYIEGPLPLVRPDSTRCSGVDVGASYQYADDDWHELGPLTDYDLVGCNREGTGLFALERVSVVDMVCLVPDTDEIGPIALFAAERYCRNRQAVLCVDPPSGWRSVADVAADRLASVFSSPNVATYFPRPTARPGTGLNRTPSALGALVGRLASLGLSANSPAVDALDLRCRARLSCSLDERDLGVLRRLGVNGLRERPGGTLVAAGLVTMDRRRGLHGEWSDLRLRRLVLFIVGAIARGTRWAAFADNDEQAWPDVRRQVEDFLTELRDTGALPGYGPPWYIVREREKVPAARDACGSAAAGGLGVSGFIVGLALRGDRISAFQFAHDRLECRVRPVGWQPGIRLAS